ncbi:MAG: TetR/AcrR family transcriptional regulator [Gammaproteobacteria bacterium]|nr:TetR/AcrR family transcriptional regulator [Gammaproteobacteria bacterium]
MGEKAHHTKQRILETAERIILQKGFAGTSIDEIIAGTHITKGGFFYHFKSKNELATALLQRYLDADDLFFRGLLDRARSLVEDPLQQMLIFLKLLAEAMAALPETHPGCLVAAFTYESQQFDAMVIRKNREGMLSWRKLFAEQLILIEHHYRPRFETSVDDLADMLSSCLEGGIILSRVLDEPQALVKQILHYRDYLRMLYEK